MSSPSCVAARRRFRVHLLLTAQPGGLAAAGVDQPPRRDRGQPRARVARRVLGPRPQRLQQRLLQRVLGGVEVLAPPDQPGEHPRDESAQRALVQPSHRLVDHARVSRPRTLPHDLPDVDPLVQRLSARAGLGGGVGRELDRALVRVDVDHPPAGDQVAGLGMRAVGGDGGGVRAAVAHPGLRRRECLRVDVLAVGLEQLADVMLEGDVRLHVLGRPLVHRGHGAVRLRAAAVVLEEQVLRHGGGLLVSVVGRAGRGPSPGERSRPALLDMESPAGHSPAIRGYGDEERPSAASMRSSRRPS